MARRNLLLNLSLFKLDDMVICENVLAKSRKELEDGNAPLVYSNKQLDSSSYNVRMLLDSARLPLVVKSDDSFSSKAKLDIALGEFIT